MDEEGASVEVDVDEMRVLADLNVDHGVLAGLHEQERQLHGVRLPRARPCGGVARDERLAHLELLGELRKVLLLLLDAGRRADLLAPQVLDLRLARAPGNPFFVLSKQETNFSTSFSLPYNFWLICNPALRSSAPH